MAVRVPPKSAGHPSQPAPSGNTLPASLTYALIGAGLTQGDVSPQKAAAALLHALLQHGFGNAKGGLAANLQAALSQFQRANGLIVSGRLDAATVKALTKQGVISTDPRLAPGVAAAKDGFDAGHAKAAAASTPVASSEPQTLAGLAQQMTRAAVDGSRKALDVLGSWLAKGAADSPKDGRQAMAQGTDASVVPPASPGASERNEAAVAYREVAGYAAHASSSAKQRASGPGRQKPTERGLDEEGDPDAEAGRGHHPQGHSPGDGEGGGTAGGGAEGDDAEGATVGEDEGTERFTGNAPSGDTDPWNEDRGHAIDDDGSTDAAGHYRVALLRVQVARALDRIGKDAEAANRATTFTWDVRLYAPGVYGPGQKPEVLLHLVVERAAAFDRAWVRAAEALTRLLAQHDPEATPPTSDDVLAAIRRARMR